MTVREYRRIALTQPEAIESSHMNHPDFRVRDKIFATISSVERGEGALKLTPPQQEQCIKENPEIFNPAAGGWGRRGWTTVRFGPATPEIIKRAMELAWRNTAPKRLVAAVNAHS